MKRRLTALFGVALLMMTMSGCSIFRSEYPDYDVTAYLNALLMSNYQGDNTSYMDITGQSGTKAAENQKLTVENGTVYFCNLFEINPSDDQLTEINELVKKAYSLTKYTVQKQQQTAEGYTVNIEITPLTVFTDYLPEANNLRKNAKELLGETTTSKKSNQTDAQATADDEDTNSTDEENADNTEDTKDAKEQKSESTMVNLTEPFVKRVIEDCRQRLNTPKYGTSQVISMKIIRTDKGELQLDTTQLEEIDRTAVLFNAK